MEDRALSTRLGSLPRAAQVFRAAPGFTLSLVPALAAGIGLGIPVLGIVRASVVRNAPYADPVLRDAGAHDWLTGWTAARQTLPQIQNEAFRTLIGVLLALSLLLLAIALVNALTLLLARAAARRPEIALRAVLGAGGWRLVGQLLSEGALLLLLTGGLGLLVAVGVTRLLHASWPGDLPPWGPPGVDGPVLTAVLCAFALVPLVAWLSPVAVAWRRNLRRFVGTGRGSTTGRGEALVRGTLGVLQIAAALVLLTSAGLLLRGFTSAPEANREPGFDPRSTLAVHLGLPEESGPAESSRLYQDIQRGLEARPGVVDTSVASPGTWVGLGTSDFVHALTGNPTQPGWSKPARHHAVGPGFFRAIGAPLLHGREFDPTDHADAPRVMVVNEAFVSRFRLVGSGVGRRVQLHGMSVNGPWYTIVGVVGDLRAEGLGSGTEPVPKVYLSTLQHPPRNVELAVRTTGDPLALLGVVQKEVRRLAPGAELSSAMPMEQYLARFRAPLSWFAGLFGVLAAVALLLATSGLQGIMSYSVARRTREIGVRMALGAQIRDITRMILGQSLRITAMGAVMGAIVVSGVARLLQTLLSGVEPLDPLLFLGVAVLLGGVALLASYRPARRAATVDPQVSLRAE